MTVEELVEKYKQGKNAVTVEELARREMEIWEAAKSTPLYKPGERHPRERLLVALLGEPLAALHRRAILYGYGPVAKPIWERINVKQMSVPTGISLVQEAKHIAVDNGVEMDVALKHALDVYDSRPFVRHVEGVPTRMGPPRKKGAPPKAKRKAIRGKPQMVQGADTILVSKIRKDISLYLDNRLKGVDQILKDQLLRETAVEVRILLREFDSKLRRLAGLYEEAAQADVEVLHRDVVDACHILCMDPPAKGKSANLETAKKQKKRLARLYHPDAHGGEEKLSMRQKFDEVMAAFDRLEKYNEKLKPTGKEKGSDGDGTQDGEHRA